MDAVSARVAIASASEFHPPGSFPPTPSSRLVAGSPTSKIITRMTYGARSGVRGSLPLSTTASSVASSATGPPPAVSEGFPIPSSGVRIPARCPAAGSSTDPVTSVLLASSPASRDTVLWAAGEQLAIERSLPNKNKPKSATAGVVPFRTVTPLYAGGSSRAGAIRRGTWNRDSAGKDNMAHQATSSAQSIAVALRPRVSGRRQRRDSTPEVDSHMNRGAWLSRPFGGSPPLPPPGHSGLSFASGTPSDRTADSKVLATDYLALRPGRPPPLRENPGGVNGQPISKKTAVTISSPPSSIKVTYNSNISLTTTKTADYQGRFPLVSTASPSESPISHAATYVVGNPGNLTGTDLLESLADTCHTRGQSCSSSTAARLLFATVGRLPPGDEIKSTGCTQNSRCGSLTADPHDQELHFLSSSLSQISGKPRSRRNARRRHQSRLARSGLRGLFSVPKGFRRQESYQRHRRSLSAGSPSVELAHTFGTTGLCGPVNDHETRAHQGVNDPPSYAVGASTANSDCSPDESPLADRQLAQLLWPMANGHRLAPPQGDCSPPSGTTHGPKTASPDSGQAGLHNSLIVLENDDEDTYREEETEIEGATGEPAPESSATAAAKYNIALALPCGSKDVGSSALLRELDDPESEMSSLLGADWIDMRDHQIGHRRGRLRQSNETDLPFQLGQIACDVASEIAVRGVPPHASSSLSYAMAGGLDQASLPAGPEIALAASRLSATDIEAGNLEREYRAAEPPCTTDSLSSEFTWPPVNPAGLKGSYNPTLTQDYPSSQSQRLPRCSVEYPHSKKIARKTRIRFPVDHVIVEAVSDALLSGATFTRCGKIESAYRKRQSFPITPDSLTRNRVDAGATPASGDLSAAQDNPLSSLMPSTCHKGSFLSHYFDPADKNFLAIARYLERRSNLSLLKSARSSCPRQSSSRFRRLLARQKSPRFLHAVCSGYAATKIHLLDFGDRRGVVRRTDEGSVVSTLRPVNSNGKGCFADRATEQEAAGEDVPDAQPSDRAEEQASPKIGSLMAESQGLSVQGSTNFSICQSVVARTPQRTAEKEDLGSTEVPLLLLEQLSQKSQSSRATRSAVEETVRQATPATVRLAGLGTTEFEKTVQPAIVADLQQDGTSIVTVSVPGRHPPSLGDTPASPMETHRSVRTPLPQRLCCLREPPKSEQSEVGPATSSDLPTRLMPGSSAEGLVSTSINLSPRHLRPTIAQAVSRSSPSSSSAKSLLYGEIPPRRWRHYFAPDSPVEIHLPFKSPKCIAMGCCAAAAGPALSCKKARGAVPACHLPASPSRAFGQEISASGLCINGPRTSKTRLPNLIDSTLLVQTGSARSKTSTAWPLPHGEEMHRGAESATSCHRVAVHGEPGCSRELQEDTHQPQHGRLGRVASAGSTRDIGSASGNSGQRPRSHRPFSLGSMGAVCLSPLANVIRQAGPVSPTSFSPNEVRCTNHAAAAAGQNELDKLEHPPTRHHAGAEIGNGPRPTSEQAACDPALFLDASMGAAPRPTSVAYEPRWSDPSAIRTQRHALITADAPLEMLRESLQPIISGKGGMETISDRSKSAEGTRLRPAQGMSEPPTSLLPALRAHSPSEKRERVAAPIQSICSITAGASPSKPSYGYVLASESAHRRAAESMKKWRCPFQGKWPPVSRSTAESRIRRFLDLVIMKRRLHRIRELQESARTIQRWYKRILRERALGKQASTRFEGIECHQQDAVSMRPEGDFGLGPLPAEVSGAREWNSGPTSLPSDEYEAEKGRVEQEGEKGTETAMYDDEHSGVAAIALRAGTLQNSVKERKASDGILGVKSSTQAVAKVRKQRAAVNPAKCHPLQAVIIEPGNASLRDPSSSRRGDARVKTFPCSSQQSVFVKPQCVDWIRQSCNCGPYNHTCSHPTFPPTDCFQEEGPSASKQLARRYAHRFPGLSVRPRPGHHLTPVAQMPSIFPSVCTHLHVPPVSEFHCRTDGRPSTAASCGFHEVASLYALKQPLIEPSIRSDNLTCRVDKSATLSRGAHRAKDTVQSDPFNDGHEEEEKIEEEEGKQESTDFSEDFGGGGRFLMAMENARSDGRHPTDNHLRGLANRVDHYNEDVEVAESIGPVMLTQLATIDAEDHSTDYIAGDATVDDLAYPWSGPRHGRLMAFPWPREIAASCSAYSQRHRSCSQRRDGSFFRGKVSPVPLYTACGKAERLSCQNSMASAMKGHPGNVPVLAAQPAAHRSRRTQELGRTVAHVDLMPCHRRAISLRHPSTGAPVSSCSWQRIPVPPARRRTPNRNCAAPVLIRPRRLPDKLSPWYRAAAGLPTSPSCSSSGSQDDRYALGRVTYPDSIPSVPAPFGHSERDYRPAEGSFWACLPGVPSRSPGQKLTRASDAYGIKSAANRQQSYCSQQLCDRRNIF